jgi:hypothetical protein
MRYSWLHVLGCGVALSACLAGPLGAWWAPSLVTAKVARAIQDKASAKAALELAAKIDRLVAARWEAAKVQPAAPAGDAEFLRRIYLDLVGRIPSVAEARAFLSDTRPDRRQRLVDQLLASPAYASHAANVWRALLIPDKNTDGFFSQAETETWLRKQFAANKGYDKIVWELLALPGDPARFYSSKRNEPEGIGAATARLFLGVSIECAQCHDHPFAKWKREQFWEFAGFFAGFGDGEDRREIAISGGSKIVQASFLDGTEPKWKYDVSPRQTLADWMTAPKNPYFARAGANRIWAYFLGTGLVEPVDDLRPENAPSNPELFDELTDQFAAHKFDVKFLIRAITASRAYQLSSVKSDSGQDEPQMFARMALRGLSPEQLFDSLCLATGFREKARFSRNRDTVRSELLNLFASQDKRTEFQTSILQSLLLMNGKLMEQVTSPERSATLAAVADAPFLDTNQKLETLFLAALSRPPRADEVERFARYVGEAAAKGNGRAALGDVFWVLLNSPEFVLNH